MNLGEVREKLDLLTPLVMEEFIENYHKQPDRDFCKNPQKVAALLEKTESFEKRMELIKFVVMEKVKTIGYIDNMEKLRDIPREVDVVRSFIESAVGKDFCWKIGMHMGKYSILKATKYQFEISQGKVISPKDFICSFNPKEFDSFFNLPEIKALERSYNKT